MRRHVVRTCAAITIVAAGAGIALLAQERVAQERVAQERSAQDRPLRVVPTVDYQKYAGTWYEIARLPNRFEKKCVGDITATYTVRSDGRIDVKNRCREADGTYKDAAGIARRVDGQPPSVLEVRFAPAFLSWLPMVWGDYQVIALADDYSHAVVGSPSREYLWVLARTPRITDELYRSLLKAAEAQGFDTAPMVKVQHGT